MVDIVFLMNFAVVFILLIVKNKPAFAGLFHCFLSWSLSGFNSFNSRIVLSMDSMISGVRILFFNIVIPLWYILTYKSKTVADLVIPLVYATNSGFVYAGRYVIVYKAAITTGFYKVIIQQLFQIL